MEELNEVRRKCAELIRQRAGLQSEPLVNALSEAAR